MAGAVTDFVERTGLLRLPLATALTRARGLPRSAFGTMLAHFGLGVSLLGIVCASTWGAERIVALKPGATVSLRSYDLTFDGMAERQGPNYRELAAHFTVRRHGDFVGVMEPAKRSFPSGSKANTATSISSITVPNKALASSESTVRCERSLCQRRSTSASCHPAA